MKATQNKFNRWYHWGRWVQPVLATSPWLEYSNTKAFKITGFDFIGDIKDLDHHYFVLKKDLKKIERFTEEKLLKDKKWFDDFFLLCDKKVKQVLSFESKKDINRFFREVPECLSYSLIIEFLDYGVEKYLEKLSQKTGITVENVLFQIKPCKKTFLMKYQDELKNLKEKDVLQFIKKHRWIGTHHFKGSPLNKARVRKELLEVSKKKKESPKKIKLPKEYKEVVKIGSKLAFYRSYLVETVDRVTFNYWPVIKKITSNNNLSWDEILLLTHYELIKLNKEKILPQNYQERKNGFGVMNVNNEIIIVAGKKLRKEIDECQEEIQTKDIAELKGMVAYQGKAKGIVKIIEHIKDISKLKKGEILVSNETTPDYIIGMKIAGAIITNQGGITSHAAIISRELNIPCIIGTKIATKVLKDGDLVEVNAEKGIVRILKRSS